MSGHLSLDVMFIRYVIEDFCDLCRSIQGDTLQRWRTEPLIMITGSGRYCKFDVFSLNSNLFKFLLRFMQFDW